MNAALIVQRKSDICAVKFRILIEKDSKMAGLGTIINTAAIVIAGLLGLLFGKLLKNPDLIKTIYWKDVVDFDKKTDW